MITVTSSKCSVYKMAIARSRVTLACARHESQKTEQVPPQKLEVISHSSLIQGYSSA